LDGGGNIVSGPLGKGALTLATDTGAAANTSSIEALGGARTLANAIRLPLLASKLAVRGPNDLTLSGNIGLPDSDFGGVIMNGSGVLTLSGTNNYQNDTLVNSGTMRVNGSIAQTKSVTVASGATLGGTGSISIAAPSLLTNNGTIAPGATPGTPGTLSVTGNVTDGANSIWAIDLSGASSDRLAVTGNIDLQATDTLNVTGIGSLATTFTIATYTGTLSGTFDTTNLPAGYTIDYGTLSNSQITITSPNSGVGLASVPEPGTLMLMAVAMGLVSGYGRRRN